jgi:predicted DNA-binding ribbon-helix-helix protein
VTLDEIRAAVDVELAEVQAQLTSLREAKANVASSIRDLVVKEHELLSTQRKLAAPKAKRSKAAAAPVTE